MSETINELYLNYVNNIGASMENDRYFRYLFEIVQAGQNVLQQNRQVLHKVVDEEWLTVIEDSLDAINSIIEKPRRFVNRVEEVVPVALARKITAESVRHLSMNTQFIASSENGNIQPTRILNVSTEDSFDLYENRFIYHLIQKLVTFIDKRTDVIFWSTGDEIRNTMSLQSKIDDAYEEIEYKIEMKIKNRQSFAENDADNMDVFMRIDRVRRLTMALRTSAFCEIMAGCAKVRSPIQRTNLLMKDPDYRKCYNLWQFLERYDGVGYTIEEQNTALEFDEEYLLQIYTNLIANYAVFKSLSEDEPRSLENTALEKRQKLEPKFIKEIHEEIVDDYNIPDVEIRQVIIEEVTQAQLDAEARAEEEIALRQAAEKARQDAEAAAEEAYSQSQQYMQMMMDAQDRAVLAESMQASAEAVAQEAEAARAAAEEARIAAEKQASESLASCRQASAAQEAAEQARDRMQQAMAAAQTAMAEAQAANEAAQAQAKKDRAQRDEAAAAKTAADQARQKAEAAAAAAIQAREEALRQAAADRTANDQAQRLCREARAAQKSAEDASSAARTAMEQAQADLLENQTCTAAAIKKLEGKLNESSAAVTYAEDKMRRAVAARREAESLRAAAEKKSESLARAVVEAQRERDAAQSALAQSAAALAAEQEAAQNQAQSQMEQLRAEFAAREQALQQELAQTRKQLKRAQRKLEDSHWLNRLTRARTPTAEDAEETESEGTQP